MDPKIVKLFQMEKWLILSNCQTHGLAAAINLLNSGFYAEGIDIWAYKNDRTKVHSRIGDFFRVIVHPEFMADPEFQADRALNLSMIPSMWFSGYHPDCCYVFGNDGIVNGPMDAYHSVIVLAAYKLGIPADQVARFFRGDIFEKLGYFELWASEKANLLNEFRKYGLDISNDFRRWSANGPFMHSINHPSIMCIHDIARQFMQIYGVSTHETHLRPHDNLLQGPCYPVYPEIADALGVKGSYLFKTGGSYRYLSLNEFINFSYDSYQGRDKDMLHVNPQSASTLEAALEVLQS